MTYGRERWWIIDALSAVSLMSRSEHFAEPPRAERFLPPDSSVIARPAKDVYHKGQGAAGGDLSLL